MLKVMFYFGLAMIGGAGLLGYDYARQAAQAPGVQLEMATYLKSVQDRAGETFAQEEEVAATVAIHLPQVTESAATALADRGSVIMDDLAEYTPMMGMLRNSGNAPAAHEKGHRIAKPRIKGGALVSDMSSNLAAMRKRNSN